MKAHHIFCFSMLVMLSQKTISAEFWTVKILGGVHTTNSGVAAINIGNFSPLNPNPSSMAWVPCDGAWIFFHQRADGSHVEDKYIDRMLSVVLSAFKTNSSIRLSLSRDASGKCYTSQIYDNGN